MTHRCYVYLWKTHLYWLMSGIGKLQVTKVRAAWTPTSIYSFFFDRFSTYLYIFTVSVLAIMPVTRASSNSVQVEAFATSSPPQRRRRSSQELETISLTSSDADTSHSQDALPNKKLRHGKPLSRSHLPKAHVIPLSRDIIEISSDDEEETVKPQSAVPPSVIADYRRQINKIREVLIYFSCRYSGLPSSLSLIGMCQTETRPWANLQRATRYSWRKSETESTRKTWHYESCPCMFLFYWSVNLLDLR